LNPEIIKSSRHAKITGDFGETLVLYWLSRHGFECASVDHTGIDLIARNPHTAQIMGISVKSRSRSAGKGDTALSIPSDNFDKAQAACDAFGCNPYFAIVIDADDAVRVYLLSQDKLLQLHPPGKTASSWAMSPAWLARYDADPDIKQFTLDCSTSCWWVGAG